MNCSKCGSELNEKSKYCSECGELVHLENSEINEVAPSSISVKHPKLKFILPICIVSFVGILAVLFLVFHVGGYAMPKEPIKYNGDDFAITAAEYKNRFNYQVKDLKKMGDFTNEKAYDSKYYTAQLEPGIQITLLCDQKTENLQCIELHWDSNAGGNAKAFSDYMQHIFHACDPTATATEDYAFTSKMGDIKSVAGQIQTPYYNRNHIAYNVTYNNGVFTFIVIPAK